MSLEIQFVYLMSRQLLLLDSGKQILRGILGNPAPAPTSQIVFLSSKSMKNAADIES